MLRRLLGGEAVTGYSGVLGDIPAMSLAPYVNEDVPLLYVGFGPKSLEHAGRIYDGAHLRTFMTDSALSGAVARFRAGEAADARSARQALDVFPPPASRRDLSALHRRAPGDTTCRSRGTATCWSRSTIGPGGAAALPHVEAVTSVGGLIDSVATTAQMAEVAVIPGGGRPPSATPQPARGAG